MPVTKPFASFVTAHGKECPGLVLQMLGAFIPFFSTWKLVGPRRESDFFAQPVDLRSTGRNMGVTPR